MTASLLRGIGGFLSRQRAALAAALVLALLVAVFLREPIVGYGSVSFTMADISQYMSLTRIDSSHVVRNTLVTDPVTQFLPWLMFNLDELAQGRVPLWNPYNGCGVPHLANFQSAVFSPFSVLFYAFSLKFALLASAFLKLFMAGFGAFLFLRRLGLAWLAALFGGSSFMCGGHNALLVAYPHTAVVAFLPFALLAAETVLQGFEHDQRRGSRTRRTAAWIAFVLLLVAAIYAGHPETLCYCVALIALWISARLVVVWRRTRAPGAVAGVGLRFVVAALLAAGLGAPQLLPFIEYLGLSAMLELRTSTGPIALDVATWPRYFFPDLLGSPGRSSGFTPEALPPNYEAANLGYTGALVLLLALLSLPRALRDARFALFGVLAVAWVFWAHDLLGASRLVGAIGLLRHLPIPVSQCVWGFAVASCAAFQLDRWLMVPAARPRLTAVVVCGVGLLALACFWHFGKQVVQIAIERDRPTLAAIASSAHHFRWIAATFLLGLVASSAAIVVARRRWRVGLALVVVAASWAQTGWLLSFHNTACLDRYVFPVTPQIERVRELVGDARVLVVGDQELFACMNLAYRIDQPALYDALGIAAFDRLFVRLFRAFDGWRQVKRAHKQGAHMLGVEWLLTRMSAAQFDEALAKWAAAPSRELGDLRPRAFAGQLGAFECVDGPGRYWFVRAARVATTAEEAFEAVTGKEFDAAHEVVLGPEQPANFELRSAVGARGDGRIEVLERLPMRVRLRVAHTEPEYLVMATPWYPGWRATIDGEARPLLRANYAFTALDVPSGEHTLELTYAPASWTRGLWTAACCALIGSILFVRSMRRLPAARLGQDRAD